MVARRGRNAGGNAEGRRGRGERKAGGIRLAVEVEVDGAAARAVGFGAFAASTVAGRRGRSRRQSKPSLPVCHVSARCRRFYRMTGGLSGET